MTIFCANRKPPCKAGQHVSAEIETKPIYAKNSFEPYAVRAPCGHRRESVAPWCPGEPTTKHQTCFIIFEMLAGTKNKCVKQRGAGKLCGAFMLVVLFYSIVKCGSGKKARTTNKLAILAAVWLQKPCASG